ncbi:transposase [Shewanella sp. 4t3-1-2LB]|uniref:transposase n=1 Tax=Shewanella sp. 4t3-1-2LB TaxID=2817682 RepID=UPI001A9885E7|nr:transposase [Shewanella sp. 4t3-1-2LB]MBO1271122.1 transposase [Shewanella sp. 4t3-1-2LB]
MYKLYNDKEKQKLIREVIAKGKSVADVATSNGVSVSTIHRWVKDAQSFKQEQNSDKVCNQLESEIKVLTKERETLMQAMAIYIREFNK